MDFSVGAQRTWIRRNWKQSSRASHTRKCLKATSRLLRGEILEKRQVLAAGVFPLPVTSWGPPGSLVYQMSATAEIESVGDADSFTVDLNSGQTVTLTVVGDAGLQPSVELFDPAMTSIGTAVTSGHGQSTVLQTIPTSTAGNYTIEIEGANGSTGVCAVQLILNAAVEGETWNGLRNDDPDSAQDLVPGFTALAGGSATRAAVLGTVDEGERFVVNQTPRDRARPLLEANDPTGDWYRFELADGDSATIALAAAESQPMCLELFDSALNVLAMGTRAENLEQVINNFVTPDSGTYFARVAGDLCDYTLVVTREADFDSEPNNGCGLDAQDISPTGVALGALVNPCTLYGVNRNGSLFTIDLETGIGTSVGDLPQSSTEVEFDPISKRAFTQFSSNMWTGQEFDIATGSAIGPPISNGFVFNGLEWIGDQLFGAAVIYTGFPANLRILDPFRGVSTLVGPTGVDGPLSGLAYDASSDTLYGIAGGRGASDLYTIDRNTGTATVVGSTGIQAGSLEFGPGGLLYAGVTGGDGGLLYRIDPLTAASSLVGDTGFSSITGLLLGPDREDPQTGSALSLTPCGDGDAYRLEVNPGDHLSCELTMPAAGGRTLDNQLDPALELYDPVGRLVASVSSESLAHTAAVAGTYTLWVIAEDLTEGDYVLTCSGNSGAVPPFKVLQIDQPDGVRLQSAPAELTAEFSDSLLLTTIAASDLTINGEPALSVRMSDGNTARFILPDVFVEGTNRIAMANAAVKDLQQTPIDAFASVILIDTTPPGVSHSSIHDGDLVPALTAGFEYQVRFDEPLASEHIEPSDVSLRGKIRGDLEPQQLAYDPESFTLTIRYDGLPEDAYTLTLHSGDGAFEDLAGHDLDGTGDGLAGGDFVVTFSTEIQLAPCPAPLEPNDPCGGLVYQTDVSATISANEDIDRFTVDLAANRTLTVLASTDPNLRISVEVLDADDASLAAATAGGPGQEALLQTIPVVDAGTYTVVVASADNTVGDYNVQLIFNAAVEDESHEGPANDVPESAQDLGPSFIPLAHGAASRAAVLATSDGPARYWVAQARPGPLDFSQSSGMPSERRLLSPRTRPDFYRFELRSGESATLALAAVEDESVKLELLNSSSNVLAVGRATEDLNQVINNFVAAESGTYLARVTGDRAGYCLVVTRNADFDTEPNDYPDTPQRLDGSLIALGYLHGPTRRDSSRHQSPDDGRVMVPLAEQRDSQFSPFGKTDAADYAPGRMIVRFAEQVSDTVVADWARNRGGDYLGRLPIIDGAMIELSDRNADMIRTAAAWMADPAVLYAEPDYAVHSHGTFPNDELFSSLWAMHNTGQTGGAVDADIDAPEMWKEFTGSSRVVIASIDTGVDYTHEDLAANMWVNPGEIAGDGIDNDGNGYVDDIYGIDTVNGDSDPFDDNGHGSHTAGILGGVGNNGIGVAGVNWNVQIMALKFLNALGNGHVSDAIELIDYMVLMKQQHDVNLVASCNSWGGCGYSQALKDAIEASNEAGIMCVASAGNDGSDNDAAPYYPASYDLEGIIAVAATDHRDALASFSNFGSASVDLAAPGVDIVSTTPDNTYSLMSGTSMAAPHVAGAVGMLMAHSPRSSLAEIKTAILESVDTIAALDGLTHSGGRLNLNHALAWLGDEGDYYQFEADANAVMVIETFTPGGGPDQFQNRLDPFIELYGPAGQLVGIDDNGAVDGRNAVLRYSCVEGGTHTVRVASSGAAGEYVVRVTAGIDLNGWGPAHVVAAAAVADPTAGGVRPRATFHRAWSDSVLVTASEPARHLDEGSPGPIARLRNTSHQISPGRASGSRPLPRARYTLAAVWEDHVNWRHAGPTEDWNAASLPGDWFAGWC